MELSFSLLTALVAVALLLMFWRDALRQREAANTAAMESCERLGLQFLDGTAAFARWRIQRNAGRWLLRRVFVFDYTAQSIERRQGFVIMLGGRVESVGFATMQDAEPRKAVVLPIATVMPTVNVTMTFGPTNESMTKSIAGSITEPITESITGSTETPPPAKIFDLEEWRRTHPERGRLH